MERIYGDANDKFVCELDFYVTAGTSGAAGKDLFQFY